MSKITTPEFRASYVHVFEKKHNELSGKDEYSISLIFPKDADLSALKREAIRVGKEKITDFEKLLKAGKIRMPFRDGDEDKAGDPVYENSIFVNGKIYNKIGIVDKNREEIFDETEFYSGCYARARVTFSAYDHKVNKGVSMVVQAIQKLRDGEPLGGTVLDAKTAFDDFDDQEDDQGLEDLM